MFKDTKTQHCQDLNLIYKFSAMPIKISTSYFIDNDKRILKFMWRGKTPRIANTILEKNKVGGLTLPNFKTYCTALVIKRVQCG